MVCEKICQVDRSNSKYIWNPYTSAVTTTVQAIAGTYSVSTPTLSTDDTLTVADEFIYGEHIYDYESLSQKTDIMTIRMSEMVASIATAIDKFILNNLTEDGTGAYTAPSGGFLTSGNVPIILSNLCSKVAGYASNFNELFLVVENTDLPGIIQFGAGAGFNTADLWLKNGFIGSLMGVDIFVVRSGTFVSETIGTTTVSNANHRVFGVKNVTTYAQPQQVKFEEKAVSGKTGREIMAVGYIGFKAWNAKKSLIVDVTLP